MNVRCWHLTPLRSIILMHIQFRTIFCSRSRDCFEQHIEDYFYIHKTGYLQTSTSGFMIKVLVELRAKK